MFLDVCLVACYCIFRLVMKLLLYWICTQLWSFMKSTKDWIVHSLCFRYNLIFTKEDLGYNTIGADFIGDCVNGYIELHNEIVEACSPFSFRKYRLQKEKIVPGTGLHHCKSSCSPLPDTVGGDLPGAVGMSCRRSTSRSHLAFTVVAAPFAAWWRA